MSEFYDKVKALHDSKVFDDKEKYFESAYAKVEETLGKNGAFICHINEYDVYDEDITNELIDKLTDDGFKVNYDNKTGEIDVAL